MLRKLFGTPIPYARSIDICWIGGRDGLAGLLSRSRVLTKSDFELGVRLMRKRNVGDYFAVLYSPVSGRVLEENGIGNE